MLRHNSVKAKDVHNLKLNWKSEAHPSDDYTEYCNQFLNMLSKFQLMWDRHLGHVKILKYRIELTGANT